MTKNKTRLLVPYFAGGFFLLLDQLLKHFAKTNPESTFYLWKPWLGWEYMENLGIAFGLPLYANITIILTPIIILGLIYYWRKNKTRNCLSRLAVNLIFFGAVSNFIDRIVYGATIDYWRLFTVVINLADVMIVVGAGLLIWSEVGCKKKEIAGK